LLVVLFIIGVEGMIEINFNDLTKEELEKSLDLLMIERKQRLEEEREITFAIYEIRKIMIEKGWV
jgi:hypothetical protein